MSKDFSVHVEHLTRVEGHGNITLDVKNGIIEKLQWSVVEVPRFFEAILRGQYYNELRPITSRICGICSIGHSLASLKATEDALLLLGMILRPGDAAAVKEGDVFPNFTGADLNGVAVDTRTFAKKLLLIDFWSVYRSSCIQEMPHIVNLYTKYKDSGLQCIGIDLDPMMPAAKVRKFLEGQSFPMPYPNVQDNKRQIMGLLGVSMLPTTILVDASGTVRLFHVGYKAGFEKELEEIRQEAPPRQVIRKDPPLGHHPPQRPRHASRRRSSAAGAPTGRRGAGAAAHRLARAGLRVGAWPAAA